MSESKRDHAKEAKEVFEGGATRSELALRYDLVPRAAVEGIARRLTLGVEKHGEWNWKNGGPAFVKSTKNHLMKHVLNYLETGEPADLDAIGANYALLADFRERGIV